MANHDVNIAESSKDPQEECDEPAAACKEAPNRDEKENLLKKKYGGIMPKIPLLGKDHERAFFDSADWALGKQGVAPPGHRPRPSVEGLRPKLQPTPPAPSRRSSFVPQATEGADCSGLPKDPAPT